MRRLILFLCKMLFGAARHAEAATGSVIKVLPQLLDLKGRQTLSPSLFERDAYQFYLREHTNEVSGMRFAIQWQASGPAFEPMKLRLEMRGSARGDFPTQSTLECEIKPRGWLSHWTYLPVLGEDFKKVGRISAWRATIWEGDRMVSEQKSFLW